MADRTGWFADVDTKEPPEYQWQPCFETGRGHIPCFDVWFPTRAECEAWIRETLNGKGMLDVP